MAKRTKLTQADVDRGQQIIRHLLAMHTELFGMGLIKTAAELGRASDTIGWELAERMNAAGLVGKDEAKRQKRHAAWERRNARKVA